MKCNPNIMLNIRRTRSSGMKNPLKAEGINETIGIDAFSVLKLIIRVL
jgi:hypothetical protein